MLHIEAFYETLGAAEPMAVLRLQLYKTHSNTNCYQGHLKSDHYFPVGPAARRGLPARSRSLAGLPPTMLHTGENLFHFSCKSTVNDLYVVYAIKFAEKSAAGQPVISGNNVSLKIEQSRQNSRIVRASVSIRSPLEDVWEALTGYETLHTFIPGAEQSLLDFFMRFFSDQMLQKNFRFDSCTFAGLKENRCLKRWETGAEILQVGQQDIVAGFKFTARSILLVEEHMHGIPKDWQSDEIISPPRSWLVKKRRDQSWNSQTSNAFLQNSRWQTNADVRKSSDCAYRDISFQQVEGDFQV